MTLAFDRPATVTARYSDSVTVALPRGTKDRLKEAARAVGLPVSGVLRAMVTCGLDHLRSSPLAGPGITFAVEPFATVRDEIAPLWHAHWLEIGQDRELVPLDPDVDRYAHLCSTGHLAIVTARKAGRLIGYAFALIDTHLHYRSTLFASLDLYYLAPAHRGGRTALRLFQALEAELRRRDVVKCVGNTKLAADQGRLFAFLGWREAERIFVKTLGRA